MPYPSRRSTLPSVGWSGAPARHHGAVIAALATAALVAVASGTVGQASAVPVVRSAASWSLSAGAAGSRAYTVSEPGYSLGLQAATPWLTVKSAGSATGFRLPLAALIGREALPAAARWSASVSGIQLTVWTTDGARRDLLRVVVTARPAYFTVEFAGQVGSSPTRSPAFFTTGGTSLAMAEVSTGFTPDPVFFSSTRTPKVRLGPISVPPYTAPFSPPPLDVELATPAGWLGIGLKQVPDATQLSVSARGQVLVNYPLTILAHVRDTGAGGTVAAPKPSPGERTSGRWFEFPTFALTTAAGSRDGLIAYHNALSSLGAATTAAPPGTRPSWWSWPLVDTWGQQLLTDAARREDEFTASWVRRYVAVWRQHFHLQHFTVIIDSQWQATLGSATPSSRFGGVSGMQRLVGELHAQGIKVLLWWPLWVVPSGLVRQVKADPTSTTFDSTLARQMAFLLGKGKEDLHVDGLKLDWGSLIPAAGHFSRPQLGVGAAALLRYMRLLAQDAWRAQPSAVIDGSAMAPQFVRYEDLLRLYDANSAEAWSDRAAIVSAVDPLTLMDSDGWRLTGSQAVSHIVGSAVFGTPAVYYASRWSGGKPVSSSLAAALGVLLQTTQGRGQGTARPLNSDPLTGDAWAYTVGGRLTAQTLNGARAVVVYQYRGACRSPVAAEAVSLTAGPLSIPLPAGAHFVSVLPAVAAAPGAAANQAVNLTVAVGVRYTLTLQTGGC